MTISPIPPQIAAGQRLLVVDDDEDLADLLVGLVQALGMDAVGATSIAQALEVLEAAAPTVVLTDLLMPGGGGAALLHAVKARNPTIPVLVMSMVNSVEQAVALLKSGADDYLTKPLDFNVLRDRLEAVASRVSRAQDLAELEELVELAFSPATGLVWGASGAMLHVAAQLPRIARTNAAVLVHGESGTGKELIARAVHYASRRAAGPIVSVSCASIPDGLWEREFFGHVRGAFSDAGTGGPGVVAAADQGTLFLDEVGEIPLAMQSKMLRFLQEKRYRPVGSTREQAADVRIVAATNRDLPQEIAEGRFREDLYYRLNVLQLHVPPLRERKEDIPFLASHFLQRYVGEFEKPVTGFTTRAIQRLSSHDFPGNVRELENVVQQALVSTRHALVTADDILVGDPAISDALPGAGDDPAAPGEPAAGDRGGTTCAVAAPGLPFGQAKRQVNEAFERSYVADLLREHRGNVSRAAVAAGLPRKSLARIMKRYGLAAGPDGQGGRPGRPRREK